VQRGLLLQNPIHILKERNTNNEGTKSKPLRKLKVDTRKEKINIVKKNMRYETR